MKITVERFASDADSTANLWFVDAKHQCFGIEDAHHDVKVPGKTRIPAGTYKVGVRKFGGFHARYAKQFPYHRGMLEILDVPGFTDVLIHIGNTHHDTAGCLLVGEGVTCPANGIKAIQLSTKAYEQLYKKVIPSAERSELTITLIDRDRL